MRIGQHYFTWCPREEGCENLSGFQTRARSPSITPEIETIIKRHCSRYELPRSLKDVTTKSDHLSPEELARCPVILQYYRVSDRLAGLTRSCLSANQRGRGGNFFAHTLIVPADAAGLEFHNPFALARSGLFNDTVDRTTPQSIADLAEAPLSKTERDPCADLACAFSQTLDVALVERMLNCLVTASPQQPRPIILCVENPLLANSLIEAVCLLLPPGFRRTLDFSTYEPDPYRLLTGLGSVPSSKNSIIGTIPASEGGQFQFREDEYETRFSVFNLCTGKESTSAPLDGYVRYVGEAVRRCDWTSIARAHDVIEQLGVLDNPSIWTSVLPATLLITAGLKEAPHSAWESVLKAIKAGSPASSSAKRVFHFIWEPTHSLLACLPEDISEGLIAVQADLLQKERADLLESLSEKENAVVQTFADLLGAGRFHLAVSLLRLAGSESPLRQRLLRQGVCTAMAAEGSQWPGPSELRSRETNEVAAYADLLAEAVPLLNQDAEQAALVAKLLPVGLETLCKSESGFERAWGRIGPGLVPEILDRLPKKALDGFLGRLDPILSKAGKTEDRVRLLVWQMANRLDDLLKQPEPFLAAMANACEKSEDSGTTVKGILTKARAGMAGRNDRFLGSVYASLFHALSGRSREVVFSGYREFVDEKLQDGTEWRIRSGLAATPNGLELLACEFWSGVIPWQKSLARQWIAPWVRHVAKPDLKAGKALAVLLAAKACQHTEAAMAVEVLVACLEQFHTEGLRDEDIDGTFVEAVIGLSSLAALAEPRVARIIEAVDAKGLKQAAQASIKMGQLIMKARCLPGSKSPNLQAFLEDDDLRRNLEMLPEKHWIEAANWLVSGLAGLEIENERAVAAVFALLLNPTSGDFGLAESRLDLATGIIVRYLRSELLAGPFGEDPATRACSLSLYAILLRLYTASRTARHDPRASAMARSVARILGTIVAEDHRMVRRLLWARVRSHLPGEEAWIGEFQHRVEEVAREQNRKHRPLSRAIGTLRRLLQQAALWRRKREHDSSKPRGSRTA